MLILVFKNVNKSFFIYIRKTVAHFGRVLFSSLFSFIFFLHMDQLNAPTRSKLSCIPVTCHHRVIYSSQKLKICRTTWSIHAYIHTYRSKDEYVAIDQNFRINSSIFTSGCVKQLNNMAHWVADHPLFSWAKVLEQIFILRLTLNSWLHMPCLQ